MAYNNRGVSVDVVIDIETVVIPPTPDEIEEFKANWKPSGNAKKEETVERQREEAFANIEQTISEKRRYSIGGKRMVCAAMGTISHISQSVTDIESWASDDLKEITTGIAKYVEKLQDFNLIGWNHKTFDMPELAKSFRLTGVRPKHKPSKWGVIDLCQYPFDRKSLKEVARAFGLEVLQVDGSDVSRLHADKEWDKLREYNEHDVYITGELFLAASTIFTF